MASCWPAPTGTGRCGCGTRPPASLVRILHATSSPNAVLGVAFSPMAGCWPAPTGTEPCGCGIRPPARPGRRTPAHPRHRRMRDLQRRLARGGVQPQWQAASQRRRGRNRAAAGIRSPASPSAPPPSVPTPAHRAAGVAYSSAGRLLAAPAPGPRAAVGPRYRPAGPRPPRRHRRIGVAYSPDGRLLASADTGNTVQLWNPPPAPRAASCTHHNVWGRGVQPPRPAAGQRRHPRGRTAAAPCHRPAIPCPARPRRDYRLGRGFSPTGTAGQRPHRWHRTSVADSGQPADIRRRRVIGVGSAPTAGCWPPLALMAPCDCGTRPPAPVRVLHPADGVPAVAFSPNGRLLAGANGGAVQLYNPATGRPVGTPFPADSTLPAGVEGVAFSPGANCWPAPTSRAQCDSGTYQRS